MNILFICNQGENRSRTAAEMFSREFSTVFAGLFSEPSLDEKRLAWADAVIVMEDSQRSEIAKRFPKQYLMKQILSLDIPDVYSYNQPELRQVLRERMLVVKPLLKLPLGVR